MLNNKNLNIVLAFIIAISLWAYVLGDVNPKTDITVRDVPISFVNEDILENSGYVVLQQSQQSINITVTGARTDVTTVKQSDFSVVADVEALSYGSNVVRLHVVGPDNVEITNISTDKIDVTVDKLVSDQKEIQVVVTGEIEDGKEAYILETSKDQVTGAETLVKQVDKVHAIVDGSQIEGTLKTISAKLEPVDAAGKTIEKLYLDSKSINVTAVMHNTKTVKLEVPVENQSTDGFERSVTLPKTIVIKGEESVIANISVITCQKIDLGDYQESTKVKLEPILPNGVHVGDEAINLTADVKVKAFNKTNVKIAKNDIKLQNTSAGNRYEVDVDEIVLEVVGKEGDLNNLESSDFVVTADVKGLGEGTHTVKISVTSNKNLTSIKPSITEVKIVVK